MSLLPVNNPLIAAAMGNMTPIGAPPSPPPSMGGGLMGLLNNPMFMMGAGLMGGAQPGGTFAGGLNMGLANMANMQRQQQATALLGAQIQQMQWKRQQAEDEARTKAALLKQYGTQDPTAQQRNAWALSGGDPAKYMQELQRLTEKGPLVSNTNVVNPPQGTALRALNPTETQVVDSGDPYIDTKGNLKIAPSLPEGQRRASGFSERMVNSMDLIDRLEGSEMWTGSVSGRQGALPGEFQSDKFQQLEQAKGDWIRAKLRRESGAVINDDEFVQEEEIYFPQPGDGPQTIAQKRVARIKATKAMIEEADKAYQGAPFDVKVYRGEEQPESGKKGDVWIAPDGSFYIYQ